MRKPRDIDSALKELLGQLSRRRARERREPAQVFVLWSGTDDKPVFRGVFWTREDAEEYGYCFNSFLIEPLTMNHYIREATSPAQRRTAFPPPPSHSTAS